MPSNPTLDNTITPLFDKQKIVNPDGTPNEFFIRWAQERSIDISGGITYAQLLQVLSEISVIAGVGLTGGGPIDDNVTLDLEDTAVTPGTYGDATHVAQFTVDLQGRLVFADDVPITASPSTLEIDENGTPIVTAATKINFIGATVTQPVTGEADITIAAPPPPFDLTIDDVGGPVASNVDKITFTGPSVTVTNPATGEVSVDVAATPFNLEIDDGGGPVETNVDKITFTGAGVTVTNPATGEVSVAIPGGGGTPAIYAPLVTGVLPGPDLIANTDGSCIMTRIL